MLRRQWVLQQRRDVHNIQRIGILLLCYGRAYQHPHLRQRQRLIFWRRRGRTFCRSGSGHCCRSCGWRRTHRRGSRMVLHEKAESGDGSTRIQWRLSTIRRRTHRCRDPRRSCYGYCADVASNLATALDNGVVGYSLGGCDRRRDDKVPIVGPRSRRDWDGRALRNSRLRNYVAQIRH
jgi:hypothetical protein